MVLSYKIHGGPEGSVSILVTRGAPTPIQNTCEDMEDTSGFPVTRSLFFSTGLRGFASVG